MGCLAVVATFAAWAGVPDNPADLHPIAVGARAPAFSARMADGTLRVFSPEGYQEPTIFLSDSRLEDARAFHIAFHVDDATLAKQREYGIDLETTSGTKQHELPVPSVFVIDTPGIVRFVYSNPDFRVRLGADAWGAAAPFAVVK